MNTRLFSGLLLGVILVVTAVTSVSAGTTPGSLAFSNTPLVRPEGGSEPAISIASNGTMAITGLQWVFDPNLYGTHLWTGPFGSTPTFRGLLDNDLQKPSKLIFGSGDADVDIGSTGTLHATSLIFLINPAYNNAQLGVSALACPNATSSSFSLSGCTKKIIDTAGTDRPWLTSDGKQVYISYHDSDSSTLIHVQRSDDDGFTWQNVGDPIVGQGGVTASSTYDNNIQGPIVADPFSHNVYDIFASGEIVQKGQRFTTNHIYVSRSTDAGKSWTANLVFQTTPETRLDNRFPSLAVDPTSGKLYAVWSDAHTVWFSTSSDQGSHWSPAVVVNVAPANTATFAWVAAYNGAVDVVYYGTSAASNVDSSAVWYVYVAQTTNNGASFEQSRVNNRPNHVGAICTIGVFCAAGTRNLLDLFEVTIDPQNGRAGIVYVDDTLTKDSSGNPLPQVVLARQQ